MHHDPQWATAICVASGPSFSQDQADHIAMYRAQDRCRVLVVNDCWRRIPTADVLYAADGPWWTMYIDEIEYKFGGALWTQDKLSATKFGLNYIRARPDEGLSLEPDVIHMGGNSGYQAINLAFHFGAQRIVLVGYDMQRSGGRAHWFGDHPKPLRQPNAPQQWVPRFDRLARDLAAQGVDVVNATIETALTQFERMNLCDALP